jgi:hypothetical protein
MNTRNWSIRSKIIALVAVPLVALLALWIFATALTVGPAFNLLSARTLLDSVAKPGEALVAELQVERRLSVEYLSASAADGGALAAQRINTDRAVTAFRRAASSDKAWDASSDLLRRRIGQIFTSLDGLASGRGYIDRREVDVAGAQNSYSSVIDFAFRMFSATATFDDPQIDREIRALTAVGRGREWLSQADSLLSGAQVAGQFSADGLGQLIQVIGTQRFLYADAIADLPAGDRVAYQRLIEGDAFLRLTQMQDTIVRSARSGTPPPVPAAAWQTAYGTAVPQLRAFEAQATEDLADRAAPVAVGILLRLALAGILGLLAVVVSVLVSVRVGRSLIGRLGNLRGVALRVADERLPQVVQRLQRGETVDVDVEAPALEYGTDEIGELGRAFTEVQRTAVRSAIEEAAVRRGLNEVFLNIARRSQTLLHRQLAVLDRMERRQSDPQELEDLYHVDHLATRMRRHAEDLVILAGSTPGRGWRNPVPVIDVIRGSISEVEDYKRIDVKAVETASVIGRAIGDLIHLLAELLENAASFSPPHTRVQVAGQVVPNGYAIEIEDRGLGMSAEAIDDANRRLREPPDFEPGDSARLGLFVVARLAGRHGIRVQLRPSAYGGVTAVALVPGDLITAGPMQVAIAAGPAAVPEPPALADPSGLSGLSGGSAVAAVPGGAGPSGMPRSTGPWDRPPAGIGGAPFAGTSLSAGPVAVDRPTADSPVAGRPWAFSPAAPTGAEPPAAGPPEAAPVAFTPAGELPSPVRDGRHGEPAGPTDPSTFRAFSRSRSAAPAGPDGDRTSGGSTDGDGSMNGPAVNGAGVNGLAQRRRPGPRPAPAAVASPQRPEQELSDDGLPRRIRQASLAAQLRRAPGTPVETAPRRSPEQVRSLMSALQAGTERGRRAAAVSSADGPGVPADGPGIPAHPSADRPPGNAPVGGTTWADEATAALPITAPDAPVVLHAHVGEPADAVPPPEPDVADTVVHHGEIVFRQPAGFDQTPDKDAQ